MTNVEFATALRSIADFYEAHPEMPQPYSPWVSVDTKEELAKAARTLADGAKVTKSEKGEGHTERICVVRDFGGLTLEVSAYKDNVCRKVKKMVEVDAWECSSILEPEGVNA